MAVIKFELIGNCAAAVRPRQSRHDDISPSHAGFTAHPIGGTSCGGNFAAIGRAEHAEQLCHSLAIELGGDHGARPSLT
jgi:hypothetical protein